MAKYKIRNFKSFQNKYLKFLLKNFGENGKEKLSSNDSSGLSNLKMPKQILSWQPKFNVVLPPCNF